MNQILLQEATKYRLRNPRFPYLGNTHTHTHTHTHQLNFLLDGFSSVVMNGQWHRTLHSDKSCTPLCLMTLQRGPRLAHPSELPHSSLSRRGSHPRCAMRGFTRPLPIPGSPSIFFCKWPVALAPFVCRSFSPLHNYPSTSPFHDDLPFFIHSFEDQKHLLFIFLRSAHCCSRLWLHYTRTRIDLFNVTEWKAQLFIMTLM